MKRLALSLSILLIAGLSYAAAPRIGQGTGIPLPLDIYGPATSANVVYASTASANIFLTPSANQAYNAKGRACITHLYASVSSVYTPESFTIRLLSGGTTNYAVDAATGNVVNISWPDSMPWCADVGFPLGITATAIDNTFGGRVINIDYQGFSY